MLMVGVFQRGFVRALISFKAGVTEEVLINLLDAAKLLMCLILAIDIKKLQVHLNH